MSKNTENKKTISLREHLRICLGILLIALCLITFSGKTAVGEFLAYGSAFLFGLFYPVFLVLILAFAFYLIFKRSEKSSTVRHSSFVFFGVLLLLCSSLALGSLSLCNSNAALSFSSFTGFYLTKMKSFAHTPFTVDSFSAVTSLGGGYIGLFLWMILRSVWGDIGNSIFFIALLLFGIFLLVWLPISSLASQVKKHKEEKVSYNSPFHPEKGKEKEVLVREPEVKKETVLPEIDPALKAPIGEELNKKPDDHPTSILETAVLETYLTSDTAPTIPSEERKEEIKETVVPTTSPSLTETVKEPEENYHREESILSKPVFDNISLDITKEADDFAKGSRGKDRNTFEAIEPIVPDVPLRNEVRHQDTPIAVEEKPQSGMEKTTSVLEDYAPVNPLEAVAKNVTPKTSKEQTVVIEEEEREENVVPEEKPKTVVKEEPSTPLTQEESDHEIEKRYFLEKQRKAIQAIEDRQREKNERKAQLLRFVSDTPKIYRYPLPTDALLQEHDDSAKMMINKEAADKKVHVINEVFKDYDVKAKAVSYTVGASVTRFNIETEPGERSDRIASLVDELQRSLNGDKSVRVETVVEGRSTSGIEVGNAAPMAVSFKDVFESLETNTSDNLLLPIGKDISGNIISCPLNKMPHLLIAGTTGSGKSVLVHSMIMTLIMRNYPSQMKLILIDPKQVEFIRYQECSHLFCPVISKPEKAVAALRKLVDEMERRFTVFSKYRVANIEGYYKARKGQEALMEEMPYLVCVIDEFADLMMTGGKDVVNSVQRIGQKARAAGIHMIIATQRPSKDTVPMMIKANVPCRIGLSCSAQVDSRVILDENGAETLLGRGDLLFKDSARKSLVRAQSPFLSDEEIDNILSYVKEKAGDPVYDRAFLELEEEDDEPMEEDIDPQKKLYDDVKDFVIHTGITSKESIMRNFQVTSSKADTYIATMLAEQVLMSGYGGQYVLGRAALSARQKEEQ